jgi:hypothetical protein
VESGGVAATTIQCGGVAATTIQCGGVAATTIQCGNDTVWHREDVATTTTILCGIATTYLHREDTVGVWALWVCGHYGIAR